MSILDKTSQDQSEQGKEQKEDSAVYHDINQEGREANEEQSSEEESDK